MGMGGKHKEGKRKKEGKKKKKKRGERRGLFVLPRNLTWWLKRRKKKRKNGKKKERKGIHETDWSLSKSTFIHVRRELFHAPGRGEKKRRVEREGRKKRKKMGKRKKMAHLTFQIKLQGKKKKIKKERRGGGKEGKTAPPTGFRVGQKEKEEKGREEFSRRKEKRRGKKPYTATLVSPPSEGRKRGKTKEAEGKGGKEKGNLSFLSLLTSMEKNTKGEGGKGK